jgi:2-succinyl-6-hydroxy-2,4-cyclohexadiene-1-carboxylate synthase
MERHLALAARRVDARATDRGRLVLVHGFTQSSRCWSPVDDALARDHHLVVVDAPGHGGSADARGDLWEGARAISEVGGAATYLGYSMGARYCLHAALDRPGDVARLVLVSGTAGIDDPADRARRRRDDEALADHLLEVGVARFVDEWLAQELFAALPPERAHRQERLANDAEGLASSLRLAGTGTQEPLWARVADLGMPVLVVAGELDQRYTALATRLVDSIGSNAQLAVVPRAGHTVHLEQPEAFIELVGAWLARTA